MLRRSGIRDQRPGQGSMSRSGTRDQRSVSTSGIGGDQESEIRNQGSGISVQGSVSRSGIGEQGSAIRDQDENPNPSNPKP